jgi:hypothetical protein
MGFWRSLRRPQAKAVGIETRTSPRSLSSCEVRRTHRPQQPQVDAEGPLESSQACKPPPSDKGATWCLCSVTAVTAAS